MPYGGTSPEQDKKIESCVGQVMPTLASKYSDEKERKSHAIAICKSQIMKETKSFLFTNIEFKSEGEDFFIEGYASSTNEDLGNDTITEDCLKQMAETINSKNVKIGFDHTELLGGRPTLEAVGRFIESKVENGKLWVKGVLDKTFSHFEEIKQKIVNKFLDGFSIEYQVDPQKTQVEYKEGIIHRTIGGLRSLVGIALTPRPMNQDALFNYYLKHLDENMEIKEAFSKDKPGEGGRFAACMEKMKAKGAKDPKALCAHIGRQKFGKAKMSKMAAEGKSDEILDDYYDISDLSDKDIDNEIKNFEGENKMEQTEIKNDAQKPEVKSVDFEALGKKIYEEQEQAKKIAEMKSMASELLKAELKNYKEPYINPEAKFGETPSTYDAELKAWRDAVRDPKMPTELKFQIAGKLHNKLHDYGIDRRMSGSMEFKHAGKSFDITGTGQNIQLKSFEYKALLEHDTNKVSDADYYQNAAELNDIYDPIIIDHLNNKTTLWGMMKKKDVSNIGSDSYGFRIRRGRIAGMGGDTSTYNYDENPTITGYHATKLKCRIPFMQYGAAIEVSELAIAEARGAIGDLFAKEVQFASTDLLKGINIDLYGTATGMTDGGKIMGLDLIGDDGGAYADIYGHARATYTTLQGTDAAQTGTPNVDTVLLRTALRTVEKNAANRDQLAIVCDQIQRDKILGLMQPLQRLETSARFGFEGLPVFDGIPIYADADCNDGYLYVLPMDSYYAAVLKAPTYEDLAKTTDTKKGYIRTYFAVVCENPNWVYKITGLATT